MGRSHSKGSKLGSFLRGLFTSVKVYALVGKSGTGKSFRSKLIAEKYGINYIIDDGLLISGNKIVAGKSAKKEIQYIKAIRTALFDDLRHRNTVIKTIREHKIKKILILGTSNKMVEKVTQRLHLPPVYKFIQIEEIASKEEIEKAVNSRQKDGNHVIPVPSIEIKRDYGQIFSDSIKIFFRKGFGVGKNTKIFEKSVVRPEFHNNAKKGNVIISESALSQMILHCFEEFDSRLDIKKIKIKRQQGHYNIIVAIKVPFDLPLGDQLHEVRDYTISHIERFTGIMIRELTIDVDEIIPTKENQKENSKREKK